MKVYIIKANGKFIDVAKNREEGVKIIQYEEATANRYALAAEGYPRKQKWQVIEWETGLKEAPKNLTLIWEAYVYEGASQTMVEIIEHLIFKEDLERLTNKPRWQGLGDCAVSVYSTEGPEEARELGLATWTFEKRINQTTL